MKYLLFNRKTLLFSTLLAATVHLNAQIESTHTDVKYGYTTVVYKDTTASDVDVLNALNNSIGMGDVVRVTVAPPKPATPVADKSKGEDTWLKPVNRAPVSTITASTAKSVSNIDLTINAQPKAIEKTAPVVAPPVAPAAPQANAAPVAVKTKTAVNTASKSSKSVKKVSKKSKSTGGGYKMKSHKRGKQRYSCPKF